MHSEKNDIWYGQPVEPNDPDVVRMEVNSCFAFIKYLGPNKTLFKIINNVDPKFDYIPAWLINYALSKGIGLWLQRITDYSENFEGTEFERRSYINPVYRLIKKRLKIESA